MPSSSRPRTPVPRIRGIPRSPTGSVRRLVEQNRRRDEEERGNRNGYSSSDGSDAFGDLRYSPRRRGNTFQTSAEYAEYTESSRSSLSPSLRRGRDSSERKMQIIRDAFRHICRNPTSKTHTLSEIRLEFGTPSADGVMSVSGAAFRAALPRLLHIVNVVPRELDLNERDEEFLVEQIDLDHDGKITYAEFVNFITFSDDHLRRIARSIQRKLRKTHRTDASLRQLFDDLATRDHRFVSPDKFRELLVRKLGVSLHPGELRSLIDLLDVSGNGQVRTVAASVVFF